MPQRAPRDPWVLGAGALVVLGYLGLALIHPTGEGWGRAWNLAAYWLYSAPVLCAAGIVGLWRWHRGGPRRRWLPLLAAGAGLLYPLIALLVLRAKA